MRQLIDCRLMICLLHLNNLAKATSSHIVVCPVLISHLGHSNDTNISILHCSFRIITLFSLSWWRTEVQIRSTLTHLKSPQIIHQKGDGGANDMRICLMAEVLLDMKQRQCQNILMPGFAPRTFTSLGPIPLPKKTLKQVCEGNLPSHRTNCWLLRLA